MAFDGRDYHRAWKDAASELKYTRDEYEIEGALRSIEWPLWEAIRGVFMYFSLFVGCVFIGVPVWLLGLRNEGWVVAAIICVLIVLVSVLSHWILRFLFWYEISRHVKGRRFGDPFSLRKE